MPNRKNAMGDVPILSWDLHSLVRIKFSSTINYLKILNKSNMAIIPHNKLTKSYQLL